MLLAILLKSKYAVQTANVELLIDFVLILVWIILDLIGDHALEGLCVPLSEVGFGRRVEISGLLLLISGILLVSSVHVWFRLSGLSLKRNGFRTTQVVEVLSKVLLHYEFEAVFFGYSFHFWPNDKEFVDQFGSFILTSHRFLSDGLLQVEVVLKSIRTLLRREVVAGQHHGHKVVRVFVVR